MTEREAKIKEIDNGWLLVLDKGGTIPLEELYFPRIDAALAYVKKNLKRAPND